MATSRPAVSRFLQALPPLLAITAVVAFYAFVSSGGTFVFLPLNAERTQYGSLANGFLHGHLYLTIHPGPQLTALADPYDPQQRHGVDYEADASYLNGHYYLYFSPLPALIVYLPYHALFGHFPSSFLAGFVFCTWAFLLATAFAWRAIGGRSHVALPFWILFLGLGNPIAFMLADVRMYELPIMAGAAMTATFAYALLRLMQQPTPARAAWMSLWLGLAIDARPNLGVLLAAGAFAVAVAMRRSPARWRVALAAAIPLVVVASAMLWYNAARFLDPFEFGVRYQLGGESMQGRSFCGIHNSAELKRFFDNLGRYLFFAPEIERSFPYVTLRMPHLDPAVSFPGAPEEHVGLLALMPLAALGTGLGIILARRGSRPTPATIAGAAILAGAWLVIFGLSTCRWIVLRYTLDFFLLAGIGTVVCVETALTWLASRGVRLAPLTAITAVLALYSILAGTALGFQGREHAFQRFHPKLFESISRHFG
jgi:hypothetical protein